MVEGSRLGAYRILHKIGEGGMGSVWLAEHAMLGRRAAIKVLHASFSAQPEIVTRFFNEARAATAISDPGIVQIFDFGQHVDGSAYIVMELLEGETLERRLARLGTFRVGDALRVMRQIAGSLGAAHRRGIVHRDLKPENIFLVRDSEVAGGERAKIVDFGIAKLTGDQTIKTQTSAVMGTPTYMSPEQCRGAGQVDQRSDVYALGCVLFTLLVGRPPFEADGIGEIIAMHLREPPPAPSQIAPAIPPEVDQLVLRCLAKDPARRFTSGADLAAAIGALVGSSPRIDASRELASTVMPVSSAPKPTTLSSAAREASSPAIRPRSRGVWLGIAAVAIVAAVIVVWTRTRSTGGVAETAPAAQPRPVAPVEPRPAVVEAPPAPAPASAVPPPFHDAALATYITSTLAAAVTRVNKHAVVPKKLEPPRHTGSDAAPGKPKAAPLDENGIPIQR